MLGTTAERIASLTPHTAEDYLYRGAVGTPRESVERLKWLDEAMSRQPSLIAHVLRAEVRTWQAMETGELASLEEAKQDVTAAKSILRGNAQALATSLFVHRTAALLYERTGKTKEATKRGTPPGKTPAN